MRTLKTFADVVDWGLCIGCGACAHACKSSGARMVHVEGEGFRPVFDDPTSAECHEKLPICPGYQVDARNAAAGHPAADDIGPALEVWEGWASDPDLRYRGSSGGVLSALSLFCLEHAGFSGVVHAGMDPARPWMNANHVSTTRDDILKRTGSRYAPSMPCAGLDAVAAGDGLFAFIGKPCDISAVAEIRKREPDVDRKLGLVLTFFCAGTPSTHGTLKLMRGFGPVPEPIREVHYRGAGWPGRFRVVGESGAEHGSLSYEESWGRLTAHRPLRCNLCPDGLGRLADISCGDAWHNFDTGGDPGRSLVIVRTERGRRALEQARRAGYVTLHPAGSADVLKAQQNLLQRRRTLYGRLMAFRLSGAPTTTYKGFALREAWWQLPVADRFRSVAGTLRRIVQHGWFRRRVTVPERAAPTCAQYAADVRRRS